eukprot:1417437-Rhodomonas_salina.1
MLLRFSVDALRTFVAKAGIAKHKSQQIKDYLDLFRPYGNLRHGVLAQLASKVDAASRTKATERLQEALQLRAIEIAVFDNVECSDHQEMVEALQECIEHLQEL